MPLWLTIFLAFLGNTAVWGFIQYLITRHDNRKGMLAQILKQLHKQEKDICRTQMLQLMSVYPDEKAELFRLAEYYFTQLHGNWYMTTLFRTYLKKNNIMPPIWFTEAYNNEKEKS